MAGTLTAEQIAREYADVTRQLRTLAVEEKKLKKRLNAAKAAFMEWSDAQGTDRMDGDDITIMRVQKQTASIMDGGDWRQYMEWVLSVGETDLISYKRPNAKALQEMVAAGEVLPEFIEITEYDEVTYRFKKGGDE